MHSIHKERVKSFRSKRYTWTSRIPINEMARAGFVFRPVADATDNVQCFHCGIEVCDWAPQDDALQQHLEASPDCSWARVLSAGFGVAHSVDDRLNTFSGWPHPLTGFTPTPASLAQAGFFYNPAARGDDTVQCAFCGTCLNSWEASDMPLEEHRASNPECEFVEECFETSSLCASNVSEANVTSASPGSSFSRGLSASGASPRAENTSRFAQSPSRRAQSPRSGSQRGVLSPSSKVLSPQRASNRSFSPNSTKNRVLSPNLSPSGQKLPNLSRNGSRALELPDLTPNGLNSSPTQRSISVSPIKSPVARSPKGRDPLAPNPILAFENASDGDVSDGDVSEASVARDASQGGLNASLTGRGDNDASASDLGELDQGGASAILASANANANARTSLGHGDYSGIEIEPTSANANDPSDASANNATLSELSEMHSEMIDMSVTVDEAEPEVNGQVQAAAQDVQDAQSAQDAQSQDVSMDVSEEAAGAAAADTTMNTPSDASDRSAQDASVRMSTESASASANANASASVRMSIDNVRRSARLSGTASGTQLGSAELNAPKALGEHDVNDARLTRLSGKRASAGVSRASRLSRPSLASQSLVDPSIYHTVGDISMAEAEAELPELAEAEAANATAETTAEGDATADATEGAEGASEHTVSMANSTASDSSVADSNASDSTASADPSMVTVSVQEVTVDSGDSGDSGSGSENSTMSAGGVSALRDPETPNASSTPNASNTNANISNTPQKPAIAAPLSVFQSAFTSTPFGRMNASKLMTTAPMPSPLMSASIDIARPSYAANNTTIESAPMYPRMPSFPTMEAPQVSMEAPEAPTGVPASPHLDTESIYVSANDKDDSTPSPVRSPLRSSTIGSEANSPSKNSFDQLMADLSTPRGTPGAELLTEAKPEVRIAVPTIKELIKEFGSGLPEASIERLTSQDAKKRSAKEWQTLLADEVCQQLDLVTMRAIEAAERERERVLRSVRAAYQP